MINKTAENTKHSVMTLYHDLLKVRQDEREDERQKKIDEKEATIESEEVNEDGTPLTKKEKREEAINRWQDVIIGLTGDDLEYRPKKSSRKKYSKWIGDDTEDGNIISIGKPKKRKKKNYQKEFDPELNMLKTIVAEQNRFTADLQRRYHNTAGPNTKSAPPLNKTMVELAAVINSSRGNSLGVLREISGVKKTIADLYMKQKKIDLDGSGGSSFDSNDLGLLGSDIFNNIGHPTGYDTQQGYAPQQFQTNPINSQSGQQPGQQQYAVQQQPVVHHAQVATNTGMVFPKYDPNEWDGGGIDVGDTIFENMDKTIIVEWKKEDDIARFKAIDNNTKEEIPGYPVPTSIVKTFDEDTLIAKDSFDQIYPLEII